jgi:hypothetical protein
MAYVSQMHCSCRFFTPHLKTLQEAEIIKRWITARPAKWNIGRCRRCLSCNIPDRLKKSRKNFIKTDDSGPTTEEGLHHYFPFDFDICLKLAVITSSSPVIEQLVLCASEINNFFLITISLAITQLPLFASSYLLPRATRWLYLN